MSLLVSVQIPEIYIVTLWKHPNMSYITSNGALIHSCVMVLALLRPPPLVFVHVVEQIC